MDVKRLGVLVALGIGLGIYFGVAKKKDEAKQDAPPPTSRETTSVPPPAPIEREPVFTAPTGDAAEARVIDVAMRAVYDRCSKHFVFREGSTLDGTYVVRSSKRDPERVNVSVKLAHPEKARGNVLWYMITFDKKMPTTITATKDIAAELCDIPERNVAVDL